MTIGNIKAVCVHVQISIKTNQSNADHMILALTVNRLYIQRTLSAGKLMQIWSEHIIIWTSHNIVPTPYRRI